MKLIYFHHHVIHTADFHLKAAVVRCNKNLTHAFNDCSFKREKKNYREGKENKESHKPKALRNRGFPPKWK